jgi:hypothetical protein
MPAAARTTDSSACRLPITGPHRRAIAACAASKEPQQLPDHLPPALVEEVFQLAGREPGRGGAGELGGQRGEEEEPVTVRFSVFSLRDQAG